MREQKKQLGQKIILGILLLCIAGLTVFSYLNYIQSEEKVSFLENARGMIVDDLKEIQLDLNKLAKENEGHVEEIEQNRRRISLLLDSIRFLEVDYQILGRYRKELAEIRNENRTLHRMNDSIRKQNFLLSREIDSTNLRFIELERYSQALKSANDNLSQFNDSLINENIQLAARVKGGHSVIITGLKGSAYKVRSNGKVLETNKVGQTERLRACFNLATNTLVKPGEMEFYLQFINPDNQIVGSGDFEVFGGQKLVYSKKIVLDYNNKPLGICDYIIVKDLDVSGEYRVNLFQRESLLASAVFTLK